MTTFPAEAFEVVIQDGIWQLLPQTTRLQVEPVFTVARGSGVVEYSAEFGKSRKLPGTRLSVEYVRSVVIGYDDNTHTWRLGFHLARTPEEKPRWLELIHWPPGENLAWATPAQQAARELSEHIGCQLKIFGAEKLPQPISNDSSRSGITGPLAAHQREDIGPQRVKLFAQSVKLPAQFPHMLLEGTRDGVTLKIAKEVVGSKKDRVAPAYCQISVDTKHNVVRMLPPTGLLNAFFGGPSGREIKSSDVRNVELRHVVAREHTTEPAGQGQKLLREVTHTHYVWDIFLTLPKESLLIAQTSHSTNSELSRKRAMAGDKFSVNTQAGMDYLRQHQEDQEAYENAEAHAWTIAIVIASHLNVHLVKTELSPDAS